MRIVVIVSVVALIALAGCVRTERDAGVNNLWRKNTTYFEPGVTTEQDVLTALGPPSQLIALKEYTVYYYMLEQTNSDKMIAIVYNRTDEHVIYDRAIFFFDQAGILQRWAKSDECLPLRQGPACPPEGPVCQPICPPQTGQACN